MEFFAVSLVSLAHSDLVFTSRILSGLDSFSPLDQFLLVRLCCLRVRCSEPVGKLAEWKEVWDFCWVWEIADWRTGWRR